MSDSQKLAVEIVVDQLGLDAAENRIKNQTEPNSDEQLGLLSHARRHAADRQEVEA